MRSQFDDVDAYIGPAMTVQGPMHGSGRLLVAGCIRGDVRLDGVLEVLPGGRVEACRVEVHEARVAGRVRGTLKASGEVEVLPGGELDGEVQALRVRRHGAEVVAVGIHGPHAAASPDTGVDPGADAGATADVAATAVAAPAPGSPRAAAQHRIPPPPRMPAFGRVRARLRAAGRAGQDPARQDDPAHGEVAP